jgi:glycogen phosphorylase
MSQITTDRPIAYFCAEYGFDPKLPLYAGGLGVLAGDTLKQASDDNVPMVGIGLLYRGSKAIQRIDEEGNQSEEDMPVDPLSLGFEHVYVPKEELPLFVRIHLTTQDVWARVWKKNIGSVPLYLLDTDTDQNRPEDRDIAKALYHGKDEDVIRQQMILGIGGVKLLDALDIHPKLYHVNEGRPSFLFLQLIRQIMERSGLPYHEAFKVAKNSIVYTNHTLVREGNKTYETSVLAQYVGYYAQKMGVSIETILEPGIDPATNRFSLTHLALKTSRKASAVSQPHLELSKQTWPEFDWVQVTNGVHLPTWQSSEIAEARDNPYKLWQAHHQKKIDLANFTASKTGYTFNPDHLVIGWARRFAKYKRPDALFEDIGQLAQLLKSTDRPVHLLISGRAHTEDSDSKKALKTIIKFMQNELSGHALFIPNYDLEVSKAMVRGVDLWLNTPIKGQEASGTSGMKAAVNGVLQCTVEDGWTSEVNWHNIGWTLDSDSISDTLYLRLKDDIIPEFYDRNQDNIPENWIKRMQKTMALADQYSAKRMLSDYREKLYSSLSNKRITMKSVSQAFPQYQNQTALVRANFDVPLENGVVEDTTRIEDAVATIKLLRQNNCRVILLAHAGRPEGRFDQQSSLAPIVPILESLLQEKVVLVPHQVDYTNINLPTDSIVLIDNLRFWPQEETNDPNFAQFLSSLGNFYVNECFATCHRKHASFIGIPKHLPSYAGLSLEKEIAALSKVRLHPERPLVAVLGGAKLETKLPLVDAFAPIADYILVGGKIAVMLQDKPTPANVILGQLTQDTKDITPESAQQFAEIIMQAKTIVMNGTMGVFEQAEHQQGTKVVATAVNDTPAFTLIGGGDTETAFTQFGLESGIDHISTGGGAMLTFLVDGALVGVDALNDQTT